MNPTYRLLRGAVLLLALGCGGDSTGPAAVAPTVAVISPARGTVGTELTITGTDFREGATVSVGSSAATEVEVASATTIYARVPAGVTAGTTYPVTVRNADGTSATVSSAFTAVAPTLQYVNGATRPAGNVGSTVIIEGQGFGDVQGTGEVLFTTSTGTVAATIASADDWTNTFIVTTVPSGTVSGDVVVKTATGTSDALPFVVTSNAQFSPSTISWTATTALPAGLSGHSAQFGVVQGATGAASFVYVTGGSDTSYAPRSEVYFAPVATAGGVGAWTKTAGLPAATAFHASVLATPHNSRVKGPGYLYVLGGATAADGTPTTAIHRGTLGADGSVSAWTTVGQLPMALRSFGAVLFRGDIYLVGGATSGNVPVNAVYRARLDSLGAIGAWESQPALPAARSHAGVVQFGGFLYVIGGETGTTTPNDSSVTSSTKTAEVVYARIDLRTGNLVGPAWTVNPSALGKATAKHTAVAAGGSVLVTAGLYNGATTGSSEQTYAQFNSDGTVGSFAGATGSRTIASAGGKNLFNHAAISYVDAVGVAHVLVIGGDDVNAPGAKRGEVWYY